MFIHGHPPVLCTLCIIRDDKDRQSPFAIRSLALFTAEREGADELSFSLQHLAFKPSVPSAQILDDLCLNIPPGAAILMRGAPASLSVINKDFLQTGVLPPDDVELCAQRVNDASIIALDCSDTSLLRIGAALDLELASCDADLTERSRRAPQHAQALWANYVAGVCSTREKRVLLAAFQAWQALDRARPLPF